MLFPSSSPRLRWTFAKCDWWTGDFPRLMGILNVTPDSFSDGGTFNTLDAAVAQGRKLAEEGADLLDIGGESTRPGAVPVPIDEELRRVVPVIERLAKDVPVPISIDTTKAAVAEAALAAGATIVNDVSAAAHDAAMLELLARSDCGVILMHMRGTPQTMQHDPRYRDVVQEVRTALEERVAACVAAGVAAERIVVDPGVGFGKTPEHNFDLLSHIAELRASGRPVLIGHSRKRFLGKLLGRKTEERLAGTLGVSVALASQSVDLLRVHDVAAVRDTLRAWRALT